MKTKANPVTNNDDQTTMNGTFAGYPSKTSSITNELPPGRGPSRAKADPGVPYSQNYSRGAPARDAYGDRRRHFTPVEGLTMAKQSFKDECDINMIMSRYMKTGILDHTRQSVAQYLDVTGADFQEAQNLIAGARSMFNELPAALRERFANQPGELLAFLEKAENREEAIKLGLLNAKGGEATPLPTPPTKTAPAASTQAAGASGDAKVPDQPQPVKAG